MRAASANRPAPPRLHTALADRTPIPYFFGFGFAGAFRFFAWDFGT